jgi:hypothetical protein
MLKFRFSDKKASLKEMGYTLARLPAIGARLTHASFDMFIAPTDLLVQKIHEAASGSGLNAEQRRNGLPLFGAVVAGQRPSA